jgi:peroxiredoxin
MVDEHSRAPDFTLPKAGGDSYDDIERFCLSDELGSGPIVLAFFPAAFTSGCTEEMCAFRDSMDEFNRLDARIYGISVDLAYAQNVWIREHGLQFPMLSDWDHSVIQHYDVVQEGMYDLFNAAQRAVFVLDADGIITYKWVREGDNPDFDEFVTDLQTEVELAKAGE